MQSGVLKRMALEKGAGIISIFHTGEPESFFSTVDGCFAIVESIPAIVLDIEMTLRTYGARNILTISTPHQAGELLGHPRLAAAIIDTRFAGSGAVTLAESLRDLGVPVVFLNADPAFELDSLLGEVTVIAKPHSEQELLEALQRALLPR